MDLKRYYKYIPFLIFFFLLILWHWKLPITLEDDSYFRGLIYSMPILSLDANNFLVMRYLTWSSRTLIELNLSILLYLPGKVWRVIDSLAYVFIAVLLPKIITSSKDQISEKYLILINAISCIFVGLFIIAFYVPLSSAGWIATSANYIYPILFALLHFYLLKEYIFKSKELSSVKNVLIKILIICALLEACSSEQMLGLILLTYFLIMIFFIYKKIKLPKMFFVNIGVMILNLIYVMLCPGDTLRFARAIEIRPHPWLELNLLGKLDIGFNVFLNWGITQADVITIIFYIVFGLFCFILLKKHKSRFLCFIPAVTSLMFWYLRYCNFTSISNAIYIKFGILSLNDPKLIIIAGLINLLIVLSIIVPLLVLIYSENHDFLFIQLLVLLIVCIISAMVSGFTPIFFSQSRVYLYSHVIQVIISMLLIKRLLLKYNVMG